MEEAWKDIAGYESLYQVSSNGNIRSLDRRDSLGRKVSGRLLKHCDNGNGYQYVTLSKDGNKTHGYVHQLVAEAFLPNPNNLPEINHRDEDKKNNTADNLEWCTRKYNCNYGSHNEKLSNSLKGRASWNKEKHHSEETLKLISTKAKARYLNKENHPMHGKKMSQEAVEKMKLGHTDFYKKNQKKVKCITNGKTYDSIAKAAAELNLHPADITNVCKHKYRQTKGYIFEYCAA